MEVCALVEELFVLLGSEWAAAGGGGSPQQLPMCLGLQLLPVISALYLLALRRRTRVCQ